MRISEAQVVQDEQRRLVARVHGRERRAHRRREPAEHVGDAASRVAELKKIWEPGSKVDNWKDVRSGFPDVPLKLFGPGTDSGTFEYFTEAINGRARASRSDYQASEDDNVLVQGVSGERGGMGYFGYSYFVENQSRLNAVQISQPEDRPVRRAGRRDGPQRTPTSRSRDRSSSTRRARRSSAQRGAGVPRLHLRQRGRDRDARAIRVADAKGSSSARGRTSSSPSRLRIGTNLLSPTPVRHDAASGPLRDVVAAKRRAG